MTARIILVRHGQTEWNVTEVFRGRADIRLDETGLKQAELLAKYLSHRKLEAVYSGPMRRTLQTAEACVSRSTSSAASRYSDTRSGGNISRLRLCNLSARSRSRVTKSLITHLPPHAPEIHASSQEPA